MFKLIDEKGRLFGKINLLDLLVALLCIFSVIAIYIGITQPHRISRIIKGETKTKLIIVQVVLNKDMEWLYDYISIGDIQKGRFKENVAEILGKKWVTFSNENKCSVIDLKVKATIEAGDILIFGGRLLKPGEVFLFGSEKATFKGYVLKIEHP